MNRLTKRVVEDGGWEHVVPVEEDNPRSWLDIIEKLSYYEDTGLDPEDIYALHDYIEAKEDDRLVILPCKIGDKVFIAKEDENGLGISIIEMRVQGISVSNSGKDVILHFGGYPITTAWGSEIGKTIFLTRHEALVANY